jgi:NADH-quinone oxidoreductase subunit J
MEWLEYILAPLAVISALAVVLSRNAIYSALSLVVNLLVVAAYYALLQAHFLALAQVMIYAGAIVVIILFVLMLLNEKNQARTSWYYMAGICSLLLACLFFSAFAVVDLLGDYQFKGVASSARSLGTVLYGKYALTFEVSALLILIGLVTIVMLGKTDLKKGSNDSK